jgi:hypothetical protein
MEVSGQLHGPATLLPGKEPPVSILGGWVGPTAGREGQNLECQLFCQSWWSSYMNVKASFIERTGVVVPLWTRTREMLGSYHDRSTYYSESSLSWCTSVLPDKFRKSVMIQPTISSFQILSNLSSPYMFDAV